MSDQANESTEVKTEKREVDYLAVAESGRKAAPKASVMDEVYHDPRKQKVERAWADLAKEKGWKKDQLKTARSNWAVYFSRPDADPDTMEAEGYIPFEVSKNGTTKQVRDRGDLLWMRRAEIAQKALAAPGKHAAEQLRSVIDAKSDKYKTDFDKDIPT